MTSKQKITSSSKIVPHLWFEKDADKAAKFYASIFPDSRVDRVTPIPADTPSGPAGSVDVVEFTLAGQPFMAISAGPLDPFNHAISFIVNCADQAEIDRYWEALSAGGTIEQCGWLRDRYGVSWQIVPTVLGEMMTDPDRARARRVTEAIPPDEEVRHRGPSRRPTTRNPWKGVEHHGDATERRSGGSPPAPWKVRLVRARIQGLQEGAGVLRGCVGLEGPAVG